MGIFDTSGASTNAWNGMNPNVFGPDNASTAAGAQNGWSGLFPPTSQPTVASTSNTPNPTSTPQTSQTAPNLGLNLFNDMGPSYNNNQFASQAGVNNLSTLFPQAKMGQTYTQLGAPQQAIMNRGGVMHNAGLTQNLINQYGLERATQMLNDEEAYARRMGGGNGTFQNDASMVGYEGYRPQDWGLSITPTNALAPTQATPGTQTAPTVAANAVGNSAPTSSPQNQSRGDLLSQLFGGGNSGLASLFGNGDLGSILPLFLLMSMFGGGGGMGGGTTSQAAPQQLDNRNYRNSLFYTPFY